MSGGVRTFAQSIAAREAQWIVIVTIEGSGRASDGALYKYCSEVPPYAAGNALYRDWLIDWPRITPSHVDADGGLPTDGELEIAALDYQDTLTSEWRVEAGPTTFLAEELTTSETGVDVDSASGIAAGTTMIYVGNEAMRVTGVAGATLTVVRGQLDTDATKHLDGTPVYVRQSFVHARRMRLYLVNKDAASSAQETEIATYRVDQFEMHESLNGYVLRGRAQLKWLARIAVRRAPDRIRILGSGVTGRTAGAHFNWRPASTPDILAYGAAYPQWPNARYYLRSMRTGEIFIVSLANLIWDRGRLGTEVADIVTDDICTLVFGADPDSGIDANPSFFRNSPGPSPSSSRSSGTWNMSAHWIDLILNMAVSSAHVDDGLELANRNNTYGAWDCLPVGIGIGIPHALVDWATAIAVKHRAPEFVFPNFVVGDEPIAFGDLVTEHFLRPLGAYLVSVGGQARIIMPRFPLAGQTSVAIGPNDMLGRPVARRRPIEHRIAARQDSSDVPTSIVFEAGTGERLVINNADFGATFGQAGYYGHEDHTLPIKTPSARFIGGRNQMLEERGHARLVKRYRPRWRLAQPMDYGQYALNPGDALAVTHAELPNLSTGVRGWTSVPCEVTQSAFEIDAREGVRMAVEFFSYGPNVRVGKVAPAARIVSVAAVGGGPMDVTVTANRYTHSDDLTGRPVTDAAAFAVNDVIKLYNRVGTQVTATTQTITQISGNVIRVNGDFSGNLTAGAGNAGQILRYAGSASAISQQTTGFVFWADQAANTVGATTQTPWVYGEA